MAVNKKNNGKQTEDEKERAQAAAVAKETMTKCLKDKREAAKVTDWLVKEKMAEDKVKAAKREEHANARKRSYVRKSWQRRACRGKEVTTQPRGQM